MTKTAFNRLNLTGLFILYFLFFFISGAFAETERRFTIEVPRIAIQGVRSSDFKVLAEEKTPDGWEIAESYNGTATAEGLKNLRQKSIQTGNELEISFTKGVALLSNVAFTGDTISINQPEWGSSQSEVFLIPGILALAPPLIAVVLALLFKNVILSLFSGILLGAIVFYHYNPLAGLLHSFDYFVLDAIADRDHSSIMLFSLTLGGMIGIVATSGGIHGIINFLTKYANTRKMGQFTTWLMGMLIFFDDYANTLLVGNTMRSYTDKLKISREKLSFIVDATSAPVAGLAIISTWIGFEIGQIDAGMSIVGNIEFNAYDILIASLPYNFYSIFMLVFVLMVTLTTRDFGPMLKAEKRAFFEGKVVADGSNPLIDNSLNAENLTYNARPSASNALIPIISVILITIIGILYTGLEEQGLGFSQLSTANLRDVIGSSNPYVVLLWAALGGTIIAGSLVVSRKALTVHHTLEAWVSGVKSMMMAIIILVLAWSLAAVCFALNTNYYIISLIGGNIPLWAFPTLVFILAAVTSFATGTSYGTMGILYPLVIPLVIAMLGDSGLTAVDGSLYHSVFLATIGSVLAGALFGDHCSPISDTTVMSSMASGSDHIDHVRTQMPYAITVGIIAIVFGYLPASFGVSPMILLPLGIAAMFAVLRFIGKRIDSEDSSNGAVMSVPKAEPEAG